MSAEKRPGDESLGQSQLVKRQKSSADVNGNQSIAVVNANTQSGALIKSVQRTSSLQAPTVELSGHSGEIFACRFDPSGQFIASGSQDRTINLWKTYGQCDNYGVLKGHKNAVLDLNWSRDSNTIYSVSADKSVFSWDAETGQRVRRHEGHEDVVNCVDVTRRGTELLFTGSDDGNIRIWDPRTKAAIDVLESDFPITSVAAAEAGHELYSGGIDPDIKVWEMRKMAVLHSLLGHQDIITSLQAAPDGQLLLSNSMDNTVRTWDIRPFAPGSRLVNTFDGAVKSLEKTLVRASWDSESKRIAAGGGDNTVTIWDAHNPTRLLSKLPGHKGAVNDVRFHPTEPIILSGSIDRTLLLGELGK